MMRGKCISDTMYSSKLLRQKQALLAAERLQSCPRLELCEQGQGTAVGQDLGEVCRRGLERLQTSGGAVVNNLD